MARVELGVTWKYKLCVVHGFCTNINFPICLLLPQLLCFSQERGGETFCSMQTSCRKTEYGVTHYMLCEVTRQLCYRAFVLGLVQSPADYLAWRTMSRTQALPQRGQGSKTRSFPFASQSFYKLYHVPAVIGAVQRQGRRRERGGCASLQPV